ncbi:hypothetical protein [Amycolatopsis sp. H20-H5]|uniref:hypothetical protein n=1 Tax=Amycolatopsis sp. H20-H5 TaxID=3046309 RepID=UPI002DBFE26D|nr:hypothetical protein [Amycolatopsis sp. H20-H5]MEC3980109.1 hypothetical protein [Amycolatopsis sp. H20-H5]
MIKSGSRTVFTVLAAAFLSMFFSMFLSTPAMATADTPAQVQPLPPAELTKAVAAAHAPGALSYAKTNFRQNGQPDPATLAVAGSGVVAYVLNPDFVRGVPGVPAGIVDYVAVPVTAPDGRVATMQATLDPADPTRTWTVSSVLSDNYEQTLAGKLSPGAVLLGEPQINGWYELTGQGVRLLQASLPQTPVGQFLPLADYQREVHDRYADKLPGSAYQKNGSLGFAQKPPPVAAAADHTGAYLGIGAATLAVLAGIVILVARNRRRLRPAVGDPAV